MCNLVGSLVGGLLVSLSYLIGIKALVIVAAVLYVASALSAKKQVAELKVPPSHLPRKMARH